MRVVGMLALVLGLALLYEVGPKGLTLDQTWVHIQDVLHLRNQTPTKTVLPDTFAGQNGNG